MMGETQVMVPPVVPRRRKGESLLCEGEGEGEG